MPASKRLLLAAESDRLITALRLRLAGELRASRSRRRWTQGQLGRRIGCSQSAISDMERAEPSVSIELWHRAFAACGRRLTIDVSRDPSGETLDAPHLAMQELVLRLARNAGISGTFELRVPGATGRHSIDVCLRDDRVRPAGPRRVLESNRRRRPSCPELQLEACEGRG